MTDDPTPDFSPEAIAEAAGTPDEVGAAPDYEAMAAQVDLSDLALVRRHVYTANPREWPKPLLYALLSALEAERVARANTQQRLTAAQDLLDAVSDEMVSFTAEWHAPEIVAAFAALDALTDPDGRIDR